MDKIDCDQSWALYTSVQLAVGCFMAGLLLHAAIKSLPRRLLPWLPTIPDLAKEEVPLKVRTAQDDVVPAGKALAELKAGNRRFMAGTPLGPSACRSIDQARQALANQGQSPMAAVIGCADSRCPVEVLFDALPGDIFVLRNAGNTCTHAEGSMVGSLEFCLSALRTKLVLVLGHTSCGAIKGATATYMATKPRGPFMSHCSHHSALDGLLHDLRHVAQRAEEELPPGTSQEKIAAHAVKVNVFQTMDFLVSYSKVIRESVRSGEVEIHGAIYHLETGEVEFLGKSPLQAKWLKSEDSVPPSMSIKEQDSHV